MSFFIPPGCSFEEWDEWEETMKREHPYQYFFRWRLPILISRTYRRLWKDPWYYIRCWLWHKHNVIKLRRLPPTWHDRDYLMLHACFQLLEDFVEREKPWEFEADLKDFDEAYDGNGMDRYLDWFEIRQLYFWWKNRTDDDPNQDEEDDKQLLKLMKYRRYLWT